MKRSPLIDTLLAMETPERLKALRSLSDEEKREIRHHWPAWARDRPALAAVASKACTAGSSGPRAV